MKKLAAVLDEVFEEVEHFWVGVGHGFGVPLDGLAVVVGGTPVDGFDDTVGGGSGDFASGSYAFCGLVVVGIAAVVVVICRRRCPSHGRGRGAVIHHQMFDAAVAVR